MHIYIYTYMHMCICTHVCIYTYIHIHMNIYLYVYSKTHVFSTKEPYERDYILQKRPTIWCARSIQRNDAQ